MKNIKIKVGAVILVIGVLFSSCEKVVDVDLQESETQLVIEGVLVEGNNVFTVSISNTGAYFDTSDLNYIDDASVSLIDNTNEVSYNIPNISDGKYQQNIVAFSNTEYTLNVTYNGVQYSARSFLPSKVKIDTLEEEYEVATSFNDEGYSVFFRFYEPVNEVNYYRVKYSVNDTIQNDGDDLQVMDDIVFNGGYVRLPLFDKIFNSKDRVEVQLVHFDESSYDYFNALSGIISSGDGLLSPLSAPGNPINNWSGEGDVLGYFSAQNIDTMTIVIP